MLTEHLAGKWPFWLSPRQAIVVPVAPAHNDYALDIANKLHALGYHAEAEISGKKMNKNIREAELAQWNFVLVVGDKDREQGGVTVRSCRKTTPGGRPEQVFKTFDDLKALFQEYEENKTLEY